MSYHLKIMSNFLEFLIVDTPLDLIWFFGLCIVSFFASAVAASIGLGGGLLVLAVMTLVLPPTVLIPVHGLVQIGSNGFRAWLMRGEVKYSIIPSFILGTLIGTTLGGSLHFNLKPWILQFILGIFVLYATWSPGFSTIRPSYIRCFFAGGLSGFATMFVGGSGPLVAPFVRASCREKQQIVATQAILMASQHTFKVIAFGFLGFSFGPYIPLIVGLIAFGILGTSVGRIVLRKMPDRIFRILLQSVLTLLALRLLYASASTYFYL